MSPIRLAAFTRFAKLRCFMCFTGGVIVFKSVLHEVRAHCRPLVLRSRPCHLAYPAFHSARS